MRLALLSLVLASSTAYALPPGATGLREGANHRVGDASFVAAFHRAPTSADAEALRMRTHLAFIRDKLAAAPATSDALAARRTELLGYLGDYIAKGTTPLNTHLPWRTPVFIDDFGNICAVGYLIERSAGRELAETIANAHRYDYLEDIAAAMPEVRAWIAASGFTLDELASIQPGYQEPAVESWVRWDPPARKTGTFTHTAQYTNIVTTGAFKRGRMEGTWTVAHGDKILGKGTLHRGAGTWTSFDLDGKRIAEGPFVANDPHGTWTFFHPSGNVAATGRFENGYRDGRWTFFYDSDARTPIAKGRFVNGSLSGTWRHFDATGTLLATSRFAQTPHEQDFGWPYLLDVRPGPDGVHHEIHTTGGVDSDRLDLLSFDGERIYVQRHYSDPVVLIDDDGMVLEKVGDTWRTGSCSWPKKRKAIAHAGDLVTLHGLLAHNQTDEGCQAAKTVVGTKRAAKLDVIAASLASVRAPNPTFVKQLALGVERIRDVGWNEDQVSPTGQPTNPASANDSDSATSDVDGDASLAAGDDDNPPDLRELLASNMGWYVEWPHIDGRFIQLFHTVPGYHLRDFGNFDDDAEDASDEMKTAAAQ